MLLSTNFACEMPFPKSKGASPQQPIEEQLLKHLNADLPGKSVRSSTSTTSSHTRSLLKLDIPTNIVDAASSTESSTSASASSESPQSYNSELEDDNAVDIDATLTDAPNGYYFDRSPLVFVTSPAQCQSPLITDASLKHRDYHERTVDISHFIYSIDELSEGSGHSDILAKHERMRVEQVQEILKHQERQAMLDRPASRRTVQMMHETKPSKVMESESYSPPYGAPCSESNSSKASNRVAFRRCRILIPVSPYSGDPQVDSSQEFEALLFDWDVQCSTRASAGGARPSMSRNSRDRSSNHRSQTSLSPPTVKSSCCSCFGFSGGGNSKRPPAQTKKKKK